MEQLYPQNILERHYPILREQREKRERESVDLGVRPVAELYEVYADREAILHENEPRKHGPIGRVLNTTA